MGSIQDIANNGFGFAQGLINAGLKAVEGFYTVISGSLQK